MDFHPYDTGLVPQVLSFVQEYQNHIPERKPCGRDEFIALLAGLAALRRTPGIPAPSEISFTALPQCASSEEEAVCRTHLERTFGIQDRESLPWLGDADLDAGFSCTNLLTSCRRRRPVRGKRLCNKRDFCYHDGNRSLEACIDESIAFPKKHPKGKWNYRSRNTG